MNNHIKELAARAVEETQLMMIMEYKSFESKLYEKFAELIIEETLQVARAGMEYGPSMEHAVRVYFGIEE